MNRPIGVLALLLISGCGGVKQYADTKPTYEVPDQWSASKADAEPGEVSGGPWWEAFGDEQLNDMILSGLRANYNLQVTAARLDAARSQAKLQGT